MNTEERLNVDREDKQYMVKETVIFYSKMLIHMSIISAICGIASLIVLLIRSDEEDMIIEASILCGTLFFLSIFLWVLLKFVSKVGNFIGMIVMISSTIILCEIWALTTLTHLWIRYGLLFSLHFYVSCALKHSCKVEVGTFWCCTMYSFLRLRYSLSESWGYKIDFLFLLIMCCVFFTMFSLYRSAAYCEYERKYMLQLFERKIWKNSKEASQNAILLCRDTHIHFANKAFMNML